MLERLTPYMEAIKVFGILIVTAIVFSAGWVTNGWRLGQNLEGLHRQYAQSLADAQANAREKEAEFNKQLEDARNAATTREIILRRDAGDANAAAGRLRNEVAKLRNSLPELTAAACTQRAVALTDVFSQCVERYTGVAEKADRIASDRQTLVDAWPISKP